MVKRYFLFWLADPAYWPAGSPFQKASYAYYLVQVSTDIRYPMPVDFLAMYEKVLGL